MKLHTYKASLSNIESKCRECGQFYQHDIHAFEAPEEDWVKEFDDKFGIYSNYADFCPDKSEYISFITTLIQKEREKAYKEGQLHPDVSVAAVYGFEAGSQQVLQSVREIVESAQFDLTPIEESITLGMTENEATIVHSNGYGYNQALADILSRLDQLTKE